MAILVSDGLDPNGTGYVMNDYTFGPSYRVSLIVSVVVNLLIQGAITAYYIRSHPEFRQSWKSSATLRNECGIILISILMNAFFLSRVIDTWISLKSCAVAHYFFMFALEFQLLLYSLLQFQRFAHTVLSERIRAFVRMFIGLAGIILAVVLMLFQQSYIENNTCHFINSIQVATTVACFHFSLDVIVIYIFWRHLQQLSSKETASKLRRIVGIGIGSLVLFGAWLGFIAYANIFSDPQIVEVAYNFHFSIVLIVMLIPKHIQDVYSRIVMLAAAASQKSRVVNRRISSIVSTRRFSQNSLNRSSINRSQNSIASYTANDSRSDNSGVELIQDRDRVAIASDPEHALRVKMELEGIDWRAKIKGGASVETDQL